MSLSFKESLNQNNSGDFTGDGGNWQKHPSYECSDIYSDRGISTISSKKNISLNSRQFNITQEENSQYIPFEMPRFYDGLDLVNATISIHYETSSERHGAAQPINVVYNDKKIRFGWLIDSNVTADPGKLKFEIHAYGVAYGENGEAQAYVWKSKTNEKLNVMQSLCESDEVITQIDDSWVQELVAAVAEQAAIEVSKNLVMNEQVQLIVGSVTQYVDDLNAATNEKIDELQEVLDNKASLMHDHDGDYDAKGSADTALESAKTYTDFVANKVKNDLLNGAGPAYDTLKELGEFIDENVEAIDALETIASNKADSTHTHTVTHTPSGTVVETSLTPDGSVTSTFSGTAASHNHTFTGIEAKHNHSFSGTKATISTKYTPAGSVSSSFTGSSVTSGTPSDTATVASSTHTHEYTPNGTVSQPIFSGTAVTSDATTDADKTTVCSITDVGSLPSLTASVTNRCLTFSFNAGSLPTKDNGVSVATGDHTHSVTAAGTVSQPTFTGTKGTTTSISGTRTVASEGHTHSVTVNGSVSSTFTGTEATISTDYTPDGTVGETYVTPSGTISDTSVTPSGSVSSTFKGTAASHSHTFTGTAATLTTSAANEN